jgi:hypothetical protein
MNGRQVAAVAWIAFLAVLGAVAQLALTACDIGLHPLFARRYCPAQTTSPLASEQARERDLRDRLHEAQLRISRLPVCLPPTEHRAEIVPVPTPSPVPTPAPDQRLAIPRELSDLKGCWASVRGDIPAYTTDEKHQLVGHRRICYCLSDNSNGEARETFLGGGRCVGPLKVRLSGGRLIMSHDDLPCTNAPQGFNSIAPTDITCTQKPGDDSASCDRVAHGTDDLHFRDEIYHRVSDEYCK